MNKTLARFSLYGFLKNQQYYDPFLLLAFRQMGISYAWYGLLIAFREVVVNIMEVPSGALADLYGRRRCMILSFSAYIVSFAVFGTAGVAAAAGRLPPTVLKCVLLGGMFLFGIGDAFRTGTHKAMIFAWLRAQGREGERTRVYGYTRSWSKTGSAVSVVFACVIVFVSSNFAYVFFLAIVPYVLGIINFMGYPPEVDGERREGTTPGEVWRHLKESLLSSVGEPGLRRLILESMGFEGFFKAAKDYLQPILKVAAVVLTARVFAGVAMTDVQRSVILIGPVFFVLYILSAFASRNAHVLVRRMGDESVAARNLWGGTLLLALLLVPALYRGWHWVAIAGFVLLYVIQNLWRPVLISRFAARSDTSRAATVLSIESQAKSVSTMLIAPLLGLAIDTVTAKGLMGAAHGGFWPIGVFGTIIAAGFFLTSRSRAARA